MSKPRRRPVRPLSAPPAKAAPRGGKVPNWLLREDGYLPIADYGIIGDVPQLVPAILAELKK